MASFLGSFSVLNLALNTFGYILKNKAVALYEEGRQEILEDCSILSCSINQRSRLMEHPVESGAKIVDHKVLDPVQVRLQVALPETYFENEYQKILTLYKKSTLISLQTKAQIYDNLVVQSLPHDERVDTMNRLIFNLELREVQIVEPVFVETPKKTKSAQNQKTQKKGQVQTKSSSILFNALGGLF